MVDPIYFSTPGWAGASVLLFERRSGWLLVAVSVAVATSDRESRTPVAWNIERDDIEQY